MKAKDPAVWAVRMMIRGLFHVLGGYHVEGRENVPKSGAAIFAPNHLSWADPPMVRVTVARQTWFMAGDFLFVIPILGWLIRFFSAFPVHRGRLDREALRMAEQHLKDGDLLCVFPEGGTTLTGRLMPLEGGASLLAMRSSVPIIPVGIWGTEKVLPNAAKYPHFARGGVTIRFGPAIHPNDIDAALPRKERMDRLTEEIYDAIARLLPEKYAPVPDQPRRADEVAPAKAAPAPEPGVATVQ
jgi:1-acyl-sn-glycerol-3-phosphate acyltransferase